MFPKVTLCLSGYFLMAPLLSLAMPPKWICLGSPSPVMSIEIHDGQNGRVKARIRTEKPETEAQKQCGLAYRTGIRGDEGMWFSFPPGAQPAIWMQNTLLPLDVVFVDNTGTIRCIQHGKPLDETTLSCEAPCSAVLELAEGTAERHKVVPGDHIVLGG